MTNRTITVLSLVGDIESEYDEFDLDVDLEARLRRTDWLEPSW